VIDHHHGLLWASVFCCVGHHCVSCTREAGFGV
jgi:hypothetical protein